ncbi:MAG: hypothetical protein CL666_04755 [Balneola sp.]|nr:hypothetical protein [Balneola sp.]|tara:strand:+ start:52186 stop:52479 length:294 start_codon:yes stop_codon:yes gene_type:complete
MKDIITDEPKNEQAASSAVETIVMPRHIEILEHMLGDKSHYRNHFASYEGTDDHETLLEMAELGLVTDGVKNESIYGNMIFFYATDEGKKHAFKKGA